MSQIEAMHRTCPTSSPTTRQFLYGLAFIAVVGLLGILAGAFFLASSACGCAQPAALEIINQSPATVRVDWATTGLLGTPLFRASGHIDAPACVVSGWSLGTGDVTATVSSEAATRTLRFTVAEGADRPAYLLIDAQGQVTDVAMDWPPGTDSASTCP